MFYVLFIVVCCLSLYVLFFLFWNSWMWAEQVKGKAIPLQTWTGPEGSSRLRFPDFKTVGT